jgi:dCTP deaminase
VILNGKLLLKAAPIKDMLTTKERAHGVSFGLSEAGYDIRVKQSIHLDTDDRFVLASAIEEFQMPAHLVGVVHDKSTWARQGLSVFNTVIEPGFFGGLTLEIVYHGPGSIRIPAGAGIAQVLFYELHEQARYEGKYSGQSTDPTPAIFT